MDDQDAIGTSGPRLREYTEAEIRQFLEDDKIGDEYTALIPMAGPVAALARASQLRTGVVKCAAEVECNG